MLVRRYIFFKMSNIFNRRQLICLPHNLKHANHLQSESSQVLLFRLLLCPPRKMSKVSKTPRKNLSKPHLVSAVNYFNAICLEMTVLSFKIYFKNLASKPKNLGSNWKPKTAKSFGGESRYSTFAFLSDRETRP